MEPLNILVLADIHYGGQEVKLQDDCKKQGTVLDIIKMVFHNSKEQKIDLILLPGDLVENGCADNTKENVARLRSQLLAWRVPVIVCSGNHDGKKENIFEIFEDYEGLHTIKGYQIVNFADSCKEDKKGVRDWERMEEVFKKVNHDAPLMVMQHYVIHPSITASFPVNLEHWEKVAKYYAQKGVNLSISGHAHWGSRLSMEAGVGYLTCPALCEAPFRYTIIKMNGKEYEIEEYALNCI